MKPPGRHNTLVAVLRYVFLGAVMVFVIFPLIWLAIASLKTRAAALAMPPSVIFTPDFAAYEKIIASGLIDAFIN